MSRIFSVRVLALTVTLLSATQTFASLDESAGPSAPDISQPGVAAALKLTAEQTSRLQQLSAERDAAVAAAESAEAAQAVASDFAGRMLNVLTDDQRGLYSSLFADKRLRFNFRNQKWNDVLDWLAREADLSLVMDSPPPGTFNYTDARDYSPIEAIDLMNGWLLTKGYVLIRRERMLMCVSLKGGFPEGAVPRVEADALAARGRFEFVSTLIPLEGRPAESVTAEISPLLGSYGKLEVLGATGQALVTDTASNLLQIRRMIEQIPVPVKPPAQPKPTPPPQPELVVYPIEHANPDQAGEVLKQILTGTIVVDGVAGQISVNAIPAEQAKARTIIDQLERNQGPNQQPEVRLYSTVVRDAEEMLATMGLIFPEAAFRYDARSRKLVAWAPVADQARIEQSLQQLQIEQGGTGVQTLQVYALHQLAPDSTLTVLQSLLPEARFTFEGAGNSLVVLGDSRDQAAVKTLLEQLAERRDAAAATQLRTYDISPTQATTASTLLQTLVPDIVLQADPLQSRFLIVAAADEHARVEQILSQLGDTDKRPQLKAYALNSDTEVTTVTTILTDLVPNALITPDNGGRRLFVRATESEHQQITDTLAELQKASSAPPVLRSYPLQQDSAAAEVTTVLLKLVPSAEVSADESRRRLLVRATEAEHEVLTAALQQIETGNSGSLPELRFYPLERAAAARAVTILKAIAPKAAIEADEDGERLIVTAVDSDHLRIAETLSKLEQAAPSREDRVIRVYSVNRDQKRRLDTIAAALTEELPDMRILQDAAVGEITVWARPQDHIILGTLLEQLDYQPPAELQPQLMVYALKYTEAAAVAVVLQELFPDAQITADEKADRLLVHAPAASQEVIRSAVEQLDSEEAAEKELRLMVYPISGMNPTITTQLIQTEFPEATVLSDTVAETLLIRARLEEHEQIAEILETAARSARAGVSKTLAVYPSPLSSSIYSYRFMSEAFPNASFSVYDEKLTVWATEEDHALIRKAITDMKSMEAAEDGTVRSYSVPDVQPLDLYRIATRLLPDAAVAYGSDRISVFAKEAEHARLQELIDGLRQKPAEGTQVRAFDIERIGSANALSILEKAAPGTDFVLSADGKSLIAWVSPETAANINGTLETLMNSPAAADTDELRLYPVGDLGATAATVLAQAVPGIAVSTGSRPDELAVTATATEHEQVQSVLQKLRDSRQSMPPKTLESYSVSGTGSAAALTVLQPFLDASVQVTADPSGRRLFVRADAEKHKEIRDVLDQLQVTGTPGKDLITRTYLVGAPNADEAQEIVEAMFPDVLTVTDRDRKLLVATATEEQHEEISSVAKQIAGTGTVDNSPYPQVYVIEHVSPNDVEDVLDNLFTRYDDVRISSNPESGRLVAVAREDQHQTISNLIKEVDVEGTDKDPMQLEVYDVAPLDGLSVELALRPLLSDQATVSGSRRTPEIFVSAPRSEHARISELVSRIQEMRGAAEGALTRTYRLRRGEADEAQEALKALFPDAVLVTDLGREVLIATALPVQHETIAQVVREMTGNAEGENAPSPRTYRLNGVTAETAEEVLEALFERADEVRLSLDEQNNSLIAIARPDQHETIRSILDELRPDGGMSRPKSLRAYRTPEMDGKNLPEIIRGILSPADPTATIAYDDESGQLLITAGEEGHRLAEEAISQLTQRPEREVEVFQLTYLDAFSAQLSISGLFDDGTLRDDELPLIESDTETGRLLVRATPEQLTQIRSLLIKMGEPNLAVDDPASGRSSRVRMIPVQGDPQQTLQQIRDLWPQLHSNPLRILKPQPGQSMRSLLEPGTLQTPPAAATETNSGQFSVTDDEIIGERTADNAPVIPGTEQGGEPPVVIIPSDGRLLVSSDDPVALNAMESLLRAVFSSPVTGRNRDFSIYQLRNAGAADVSTTLRQIFDSDAGALSFGTVILVAESRLNALIVYGSRSDRERIEQLLQVLDSDLIPETQRAFRTEVVAVRYADAGRVADVLEGVFRVEITSGGSRPALNIPRGVPSSVANILRQVSAVASSPLLTIEVQQQTNSLVIKAPQQLLDEVRDLIERLDNAGAQQKARGVRLLPLRKTNSARVMQMLQQVID